MPPLGARLLSSVNRTGCLLRKVRARALPARYFGQRTPEQEQRSGGKIQPVGRAAADGLSPPGFELTGDFVADLQLCSDALRSRLPKGPFAFRRHYCWLMRYLALRDFLQVGLSD